MANMHGVERPAVDADFSALEILFIRSVHDKKQLDAANLSKVLQTAHASKKNLNLFKLRRNPLS